MHKKNQYSYVDELQNIVVELSGWGMAGDLVMSSLKEGKGGDYVQGWEFQYGDGEKWTTNDKRHCDVGERW